MSSEFIHDIENETISFFFMAEYSVVSVCVCVYHIFGIHSSTDGHSGCFCILPTVHSTSMNMEVQMASLQILISGFITFISEC